MMGAGDTPRLAGAREVAEYGNALGEHLAPDSQHRVGRLVRVREVQHRTCVGPHGDVVGQFRRAAVLGRHDNQRLAGPSPDETDHR